MKTDLIGGAIAAALLALHILHTVGARKSVADIYDWLEALDNQLNRAWRYQQPDLPPLPPPAPPRVSPTIVQRLASHLLSAPEPDLPREISDPVKRTLPPVLASAEPPE